MIRFKMLLILFTFFSFPLTGDSILKYQLPLDWISSSEESISLSSSKVTPPFKETEIYLEDLFESPVRTSEDESSFVSNNKWKTRGIRFDFGVSSKGLIGLLGYKGRAAIGITWAKREFNDSDKIFYNSLSESTDDEVLQLYSNLDSAPFLEKVEDKELFNKTLSLRINEFKVFALKNLHQGKNWKLNRLRTDYSVKLSGFVSPLGINQGEFRLRIDWKVSPELINSESPNPSLSSFFNALDNSFPVIESNDRFDLSQIRIIFGVGAKGKIGIGTLGGKTKIEAHYNRVNKVSLDDVSPINSKLHKGLKRANKMAQFFARKIKPKKNWDVKAINTSFEISASGDIALSTIEGFGGLELVYKNKSLFSPDNFISTPSFYANRVQTRYRVGAGISIPGFAKFELVPEIDFVWTR